MKAMLFAAGLGTRLKPFTDKHPKALATVNGKTLLERTIKYLQQYGIYEVVINVHHFAEQIEESLAKNDGYGSNYIISDEREKVLETGGGLKLAAPFLQTASDFVAMNVDMLTNLNLTKLIAHHQEREAFATLAVMERYSSRQLLFDEAMNLKGWKHLVTGEEKLVPPIADITKQFAFSGLQVLSKEMLQLADFPEKFSTIEVFLKRAATHKIIGYDHTGDLLIDVGKPESIAQASTLFQ